MFLLTSTSQGIVSGPVQRRNAIDKRRTGIAGLASVRNNADDDLFPAVMTPRL